jgi:hypothetical protein
LSDKKTLGEIMADLQKAPETFAAGLRDDHAIGAMRDAMMSVGATKEQATRAAKALFIAGGFSSCAEWSAAGQPKVKELGRCGRGLARATAKAID